MEPQAAIPDESSEPRELARVNTFPDVPPDGEVVEDDEPATAPAPRPQTGGSWSPLALGLGVVAVAVIVLALLLILEGVFRTMPS